MSQDICISAVKEQDIEIKLRQVIADWAVVNLQFANFKQRGELLLKGVETAEIIAQLEDSLMIISSLLANRYIRQTFRPEIAEFRITGATSVRRAMLAVTMCRSRKRSSCGRLSSATRPKYWRNG